MTMQSTTHPTKRTGPYGHLLPHFDQARLWQSYAKRLRGRSFDAYLKKELALAHSLRLRSRTFVLPTLLELTLDTERGLYLLNRSEGEHRARYVELAARVIEVDEDDPTADEVHLFLEEPDRTSSRNRRYLAGLLPQEDACWVVPLLRLESDASGTGPLLGFFVEHSAIGHTARGGINADTSDVHVVIAHAHEAARQWLDWRQERAARYTEVYRVRYYDERAYEGTCATP